MIPLAGYLEDDLRWTQPLAGVRSYLLEAESATLATLRFECPGAALASGQTAHQIWRFSHTGFLKPTATIKIKGHQAILALYRATWTLANGELTLYDGTQYRFRPTNLWGTRHAFETCRGEVLLRYRSGHTFGKLSERFEATVTATEVGRESRDVELLIVAGWYFLTADRGSAALVALLDETVPAVTRPADCRG